MKSDDDDDDEEETTYSKNVQFGTAPNESVAISLISSIWSEWWQINNHSIQ